MDREGKPKPYALIEPGGVKIQRTRPGAVWMIAEAEPDKEDPLGYFSVGDRRLGRSCRSEKPQFSDAIRRRGYRWVRGR